MENNHGNKGATYFHGEYENDPYGLLAVEIVIQAIADWRLLVNKRAWENDAHCSHQCNFDAIRNFLKSDWCALLLTKTEWESARILEILEAELQTAMLQPRKKERKRKT